MMTEHADLFTAGPRIGWLFRDRKQFIRHYPDGPPAAPPVPHDLHARIQMAELNHRDRQQVARRFTALIGILFGLVGLISLGSDGLVTALAVWLVGALVAAPFLAVAAAAARRLAQARQDVDDYHARTRRQFNDFLARWEASKAAFNQQEQARVDALDEWGSVDLVAGRRRLDVFGGSMWGWEALLTVTGCSMLSTRPMLVLDLSREAVTGELSRLAAAAGITERTYAFPADLPTAPLLAELTSHQIIDALVESMHGDLAHAPMGERAMDERILGQLVPALGEQISMARLVAGLRALMGEADTAPLSHAERTHIAEELFSDEYLRQSHGSLRRIEAHVNSLKDLGTAVEPDESSRLTCMSLGPELQSVRAQLLSHLLVQWLTQRIIKGYTSVPGIVVVGADELAGRHLERLSDVCERREVPLILMFRHLREAQGVQLGGGTAAFLRLGNADEAVRAADHIGRDHKFVLSQLTKTLGGNETHTMAETEGEAESDSVGTTKSTSYSRGSGPGGSTSGKTTTYGSSQSHSYTRNWSTTKSEALGTNWSDAQADQRVYEYAVEPTTLQNLPDYALLLVRTTGSTRVIDPVEFNPGIVTLDRVSLEPLPELELPVKPDWMLEAEKEPDPIQTVPPPVQGPPQPWLQHPQPQYPPPHHPYPPPPPPPPYGPYRP